MPPDTPGPGGFAPPARLNPPYDLFRPIRLRRRLGLDWRLGWLGVALRFLRRCRAGFNRRRRGLGRGVLGDGDVELALAQVVLDECAGRDLGVELQRAKEPLARFLGVAGLQEAEGELKLPACLRFDQTGATWRAGEVERGRDGAIG